MYDYKQGKKNITEILNSKTKIQKLEHIPSASKFTYENGVRAWVGSIFIDIKNSTELFISKYEKVARIMRSFTSEVIEILRSNKNFRQIGIRGDCVYGIYNAPNQNDLLDIFELAYKVNSFMKMFNTILKENNYPKIDVGIGLGANEDLIIKAGKSGTGISDRIWIGEAVVSAANLSGEANRGNINPIAMTQTFYDNIIKELKKQDPNYINWIKKKNGKNSIIDFYHCNIIDSKFDNWIKRGMKN